MLRLEFNWMGKNKIYINFKIKPKLIILKN